MTSKYIQHWDRFARQDPYFAVLTDERYRGSRLDSSTRESFFATGSDYTEFLFEAIREHFDQQFRPSVAVDFGCGVGRLAVAFSKRCTQVVAVDVSSQMLEVARQNCEFFEASNVKFLSTAEYLDQHVVADLVNAYIVFQHIPVAEGEGLYRSLLSRVRPGGFSAVHFMFKREAPAWKRALARVRGSVPGAHRLANVVQRRPSNTPHMQMNSYNLNRAFGALAELGYGHAYSILTNHGGYMGVLLLAQRRARQVP